jgi:hypothetical protein
MRAVKDSRALPLRKIEHTYHALPEEGGGLEVSILAALRETTSEVVTLLESHLEQARTKLLLIKRLLTPFLL